VEQAISVRDDSDLEPTTYCSCPLWEPCSCGAEAPVVNGYADMDPWLVDRIAEARRRLARQASTT
jgi:hypothetical protein